jgi:hypothetical protein
VRSCGCLNVEASRARKLSHGDARRGKVRVKPFSFPLDIPDAFVARRAS